MTSKKISKSEADMDANAVKTAPELKDPALAADDATAGDAEAQPNPIHPEAADAAAKIEYAESDADMDGNAVKTAPELKEKEPEAAKAAKIGDVFNGWRVDALYTDDEGAQRARIVLVANPLVSSTPLAADLGTI